MAINENTIMIDRIPNLDTYSIVPYTIYHITYL